MRVIEHKGWQIESRSYEGGAHRWCPRALVSPFDGGSTYDVRALLSVTFDTAHDADDFALALAKSWIEDREYRPRYDSRITCPEPSWTPARG